MYDVRGKLLSGIKSMYVDSSACVRIKGGVSELELIVCGQILRVRGVMTFYLFSIK